MCALEIDFFQNVMVNLLFVFLLDSVIYSESKCSAVKIFHGRDILNAMFCYLFVEKQMIILSNMILMSVVYKY